MCNRCEGIPGCALPTCRPPFWLLTPACVRPPAPRSPRRQESAEQSKLAAPLAINLIANYSLSIISLSFVGKLGDTSMLAAAALGSTLSSMSGCATVWVRGHAELPAGSV